MSDEADVKAEEGGGAPAWVMTFADLMSLLMCFFVLLLSFSEMDVQKFKQLAGSMKNAFGVQREVRAHEIPKGTSVAKHEFSPAKPKPTLLNQVKQSTTNTEQKKLGQGSSSVQKTEEQARNIAKQLEDEIAEGTIEVETDGEVIVIRILEKGSFPSGFAELNEEFMPVINKIKLSLIDVDGVIRVSGHTDNRPIETKEYLSNWHLSVMRALIVAHELMKDKRVDEARFEVSGFADKRPIVKNDTPKNRAKNRRVEIKILQGQQIPGVDSLK